MTHKLKGYWKNHQIDKRDLGKKVAQVAQSAPWHDSFGPWTVAVPSPDARLLNILDGTKSTLVVEMEPPQKCSVLHEDPSVIQQTPGVLKMQPVHNWSKPCNVNVGLFKHGSDGILIKMLIV